MFTPLLLNREGREEGEERSKQRALQNFTAKVAKVAKEREGFHFAFDQIFQMTDKLKLLRINHQLFLEKP